MMNNGVVERALQALRALNRQEQKRAASTAAIVPVQTLESANVFPESEEICFHCRGVGSCNCITCGEYQPQMVWASGECLACKAQAKRAAVIQ